MLPRKCDASITPSYLWSERFLGFAESWMDEQWSTDDLAAHAVLCEGLARLTPDIPVLSEESAPDEHPQRLGWPRLWLVDPLDGTREFVKKNGEFTVNIALIENGETVFGVVYAPALEELHYGIRGVGAFVTEADGAMRATRAATPDPVSSGACSTPNPAAPRSPPTASTPSS